MDQPFISPKEDTFTKNILIDNPECPRTVSSNNLCHQNTSSSTSTQKMQIYTQNSLIGENFNEFQLFKLENMF